MYLYIYIYSLMILEFQQVPFQISNYWKSGLRGKGGNMRI